MRYVYHGFLAPQAKDMCANVSHNVRSAFPDLYPASLRHPEHKLGASPRHMKSISLPQIKFHLATGHQEHKFTCAIALHTITMAFPQRYVLSSSKLPGAFKCALSISTFFLRAVLAMAGIFFGSIFSINCIRQYEKISVLIQRNYEPDHQEVKELHGKGTIL